MVRSRSFIAAVVACLAGCGGCRVAEYVSPEGHRLTVATFGLDTKIGSFERRPDGTVNLEQYDAQAESLRLAREALEVLGR
ncbi:MAG: hypothetical protein ACFCVE_15120 [Phycisphaerae bacterium]